MNIQEVYTVPDSTYFTLSNVAPQITADGIATYGGHGTRRSWGAPQCTTTVVVAADDFCALHVGFSHKHRGGQGWFYFIRTDTGSERRTWAKLTDDERDLVLHNLDKAPAWAKSPGKLRADYIKPAEHSFTGYKIVRAGDNQTPPAIFLSLYDASLWEMGRRRGEAVSRRAGTDDFGDSHHDGGFYVHPDMERLMRLWQAGQLVPARLLAAGERYFLIECECSGRVAHFSSGKVAVTYCKPVRIVGEVTQA